MNNKKILLAICLGMIIPILVPTALADHGESHDDCPDLTEDPDHPCWNPVRTCADDIVVRPLCEQEILFVAVGEAQYSSSLHMNTISTAIYSELQRPAVGTIYVQDHNMVPLGVLIFKTTLLAGETPIDYSFTVPIECNYNTYDHRPICNNEFPRTIYVNVFEDMTFTVPLASEFVAEELE